ncbi:MAG: LysM peptidoglycan-binding domain-containing protein [Candidatus Omnitrophica bacterium]|nr:LysM peptidoglycan-binding domain-containing protein [Candidatus Omnitrophota bacterium]
MKKIYILGVGVLFLVSGCLVRTYTVEKPRTDLEVRGNRGYIAGGEKKEQAVSSSRLGKTRKYTVVEIELGKSKREIKKETSEKASLSQSQPPLSEVPATSNVEEEVVFKESTSSKKEEEKTGFTNEQPEYKMYTVKKNDTLQKISRRFYGTTRRWLKIYKANKDILKSPDRVYPGQVLKIPQ